MSIETEFQSTIENVQNAYQGLTNLGATMPQNKNIQNISECLQEIYDNAPKTSFEEGTSITLENGLKAKIDYDTEDNKKIVGYGDTEQESTTGIQLANLDQSMNNRHDDITYTENVANSIVGSKTSNNGQFLATFVAEVVSGQSYIISGTASNCSLYGYKETLGGESFANLSNANLPITITSNYTGTIVLGMYISSLFSGTASIKNFQLEKGSTAHNWEQYTGGTPAPSPSFPFPIKSVTGNNNVVVHNANYQGGEELYQRMYAFDSTKCSKTTEDSKQVIYFRPANYRDSLGFKALDYNFKENTQYTIRGLFKYADSYGGMAIVVTYTDNTSSSIFSTNVEGWQEVRLVSTANKTISNISFTFGNPTYWYLDMSSWFIGEGDTTDYVVYQNQTKPLNLGTIELNKIGNYTDELLTDRTTKKWYKLANVGKYILPQITEDIRTGEIFGVNNTPYTVIRNLQSLINIMPVSEISYNWYCTKLHRANGIVSDYGAYIVTGNNATNMVIIVNSNDTLETLNNKLNGNVFTYVLVTPTLTEITDNNLKEQLENWYNANSFNGTTIIQSNGNLPMPIKVRVLKGE